MKTLSVIVPSYNSEAYIEKCVMTLIASSHDLEIIIVNDGSMDSTQIIAERLKVEYPSLIKVVHQRNLGHGGAVNTGIKHSTGKYIKVVDSDDWVNPESLKKVIHQLSLLEFQETPVDMMICNFMYDKVGKVNKRIMSYEKILPENMMFTWSEVGKFKQSQYILMHSVIYNRRVLEACALQLPEHTFYVDNLFVYLPMVYVDKMYYMNTCLYHYFIGRDDQSVNEANMIKRIDQQLKVNQMMIQNVDFSLMKDKRKIQYMTHYLKIVTTVSSLLLIKIGDKEAFKAKEMLWQSIKKYDYSIYLKIRTSLLGHMLHMPGLLGRKIILFTYEKAQKRLGFN